MTTPNATDVGSVTPPPERLITQLFKLLPADAEVIVEVGCGTGLMGERYKRINPHCKYLGVETNLKLAAIAKTRLDAVADTLESLPIKPEQVSCLVYNDVLSSTANLTNLLKTHSQYLKSDGLVLAYLPNLQYWHRLIKLIQGNWHDEPEFLRNSQQLAFFTLSTIKSIFIQAQLPIFDLQTDYPSLSQQQQEQFELFQSLILPLIQSMGLRAEEFKMLSLAKSFMVRATKVAITTPRLLIQTYVAAITGCERVRVSEPNRFSITIPGTRVLNHAQTQPIDLKAGLLGEQKVFIWQRALLLYPQDIQKQKQILQSDYLIVAEHDDDPYLWPENAEHKFLLFWSSHCVQTSTVALAEHLKQFNPNVQVFQNQLAYLPDERTYTDNETVTLFFGALNREKDWEAIMPALNRVLAQHKHVMVKVVHDARFFKALETSHKEFQPLCPYDKFQEIMHSCDIGVLPLLNNQFNRMKSDLKFLEHAGHGVAALASPTVYADSIVEGETGMIYHSPEEFEQKLTELIINSTLRQRLARNAYTWVRENRLLCQHYRQRREWYLEMRSQLPRLNAELRDRLPDLFTD